ncbi:RNA-directed DNA polymerase (Reverse transcriptase), partial [Trifolium medium]|nr:RNA-directed DNA polymerase (Reverse transcriptase) [Trifolium medium]
SVKVSTLTKLRSDHFPILLDFKNHDIQFSSSFKFMKMWIAHPDCFNTVKLCWNTSFIGCLMFVLNQKLKKLKETLKLWNKEVFGNIHSNVKLATAKVDSIQHDIDSLGPSDSLFEQEKIARLELEKFLGMEESYWQQKANIHWHCDGDRNTAYFHRFAKIKNTINLITSLKHGDSTLTDPNIISSHVVDHFSNLFNQNSRVTDNGLIEDVIPNLLTDNINNMLTMLPSFDEIKNAVFSLNKDSAPGPDGFGALFFQ